MAVPSEAPAPQNGLSESAADGVRAVVGPNEIAAGHRAGVPTRVARQLADPLVLVLLAAAALTIATADFREAAVILVVVVVNTTVGVGQEVRADRAMQALSTLSAPHARVRRGGIEHDVPARDLVPGDLMMLAEGDVVPADGMLLEARGLVIDEAMLTGEAVPVHKATAPAGAQDGDATDPSRLHAGTLVLGGRGEATVTATGARSELGRIAGMLNGTGPATPLQRRLAGLGRLLAALTVLLCAVVLVEGLLGGRPVELMIVAAIGLAVAAVPESLPAVVTLALSLGARRMAARRAIVRNLPAVETLGSVTVLATDKTGTLTEGRMMVERIWTPARVTQVTGNGYAPSGQFLCAEGTATGADAAGLDRLLTAAVLCNDAQLVPPDSDAGSWAALGDPTEAALLAMAGKAGISRESATAQHLRTAEEPFDSATKRMTTTHLGPDGGLTVQAKGALEALWQAGMAASCDIRTRAEEQAGAWAADGYRVLAIAAGAAASDGSRTNLSLLGLVAIADPPRPAAAQVIASCRAAGITPVLITGDHPATALAIAVRTGILDVTEGARPTTSRAVTGAELRADPLMDVTRFRVFARTTPEQKLAIVQAWQATGAVVAMTGDGVNDGPALRAADIGVAMGGRGTEVARQAADLVLADDQLATLLAAVEEGRRVYTNVRRFLLYALSGGAAEILVMLLGPALGLALPLLAAQILWVNLLTHGITGVALGAEPPSPQAMHRPPRDPREPILGGGLWQRVLAVAVAITVASLGAAVWARHTDRPWQSVLFLTLTAAQLGVALGVRDRLVDRRHLTAPLAVLASTALVLAGLYLPALRDLLETRPLPVTACLPAATALTVMMLLVHASKEFRFHRL